MVSFSLLDNAVEELRDRVGLEPLDGHLHTLSTLEIPLGFHHELSGMKFSWEGSDELNCHG